MQHYKLLLASLLVIGSAGYASAIYNDMPLFYDFIRPRCFNHTNAVSGPLLVDGQEYPLAHTLDNFISLVEKFEAANPEMPLDDMLFVFLKNYVHENLIYSHSTDFKLNKPTERFNTLLNLWEENRENNIPAHINPYDDDEICSLFYLLSHTVNDTALADEEESRTFPTPSNDGVARADERRTKQPREQGIVVIRSTGETVALSQVILGLYLGLTFTDKPLKEFFDKSMKGNGYPGDMEFRVNPLHILTLADTLLMNKWQEIFITPKAKEYGGNPIAQGYNNRDVGFGTDDICPTVFKLGENASAFQTYSLIRGSTDGLLLGSIVKEISNTPKSMRLSQILRSYYSPLGIRVPASTNKDLVYTSCNRQALLNPLSEEVEDQMGALLAILADTYSIHQRRLGEAWDDFNKKQNEIFSLPKDFCSQEIKAENLYCETPVDVIIVLDTTIGSEEIRLQQEIIGYLATELHLHKGVSTATVYLDYLNGTTSDYLEELIPQTYSSACIGCHSAQKEIKLGSGADRRIVLQTLDNILESRKNAENDLSGAPGKVVIYFNFQDKEALDSRLQKVISHFHDAHSDVTFIPVGRNEEVLKKYSGRNLFDIVKLVGNDKTSEIGASLAKKICLGPASLQYTDCKLAKDEKSASYDGYVTRSSVQHWGMDPKYFEKSYTAKLFFEARDGHIQVCYNRATTRPELEAKNCHMTNSSTRRLQFTTSNPCQGLTRGGCSPFYFSVIGIEPNEKDQVNNNHLCTDPDCSSVNQVKFTFTHEGVRCSGSSSLLSNAVFLFISALLTYIFTTK